MCEKITVDCDLSQMSLEAAVHQMGSVPLSGCILSCGMRNGYVARKLQGAHGFQVLVVPDAIVANKGWAWALWHDGRCIWSPGSL